jgi:DNA transposition AAA+ family ATPase
MGGNLKDRSQRTPGIAVVHGDTGVGKSTGLIWYGVRRERAVFVRAQQLWTPSAMLHDIADELGIDWVPNLAEMIRRIVQELAAQNKMLLVDEADYVVEQKRLINALRDIHDMSSMPMVLVGMANFLRKLRGRIDQRQFSGRIAYEIEFTPLDLEDTALLARDLLDDGLSIAEEMAAKLHEECEGSTRTICTALQRVEQLAKQKGLRKVTAKDWGTRPLNLMRAGEKTAA